MTVDLDTRMRTARDSLRRASQDLAPARPTSPPRSLRPVGVVAAAFLAVALVVGGIVVRPDHDEGLSTVVAPTSTPPRLVPADVPEGVPDLLAFDLPLPRPGAPLLGPGFGPASIAIYGDPQADDPFATADLVVAVTAQDPTAGLGDADKVTVRGRTGTVIDVGGPARFISWEEEPGTFVLVGSHALDRKQLLTAADALVVKGGRATLGSVAASVPGPLDEIGEIADYPLSALVLGTMPMGRNSAPGHMVGNENDDYDHAFFVETAVGGPPDLAVIRWITHAGTPTRVRGHDGWAGVDPANAKQRALVWQEAPGVIAVAVGTGLDRRELLDTVDGLHPATDQEWQALLAAGTASGLGPSLG
jgi:hypothetical protein